MLKIGVLVVTYNRLDKLKKALHAYSIQSYKPKTVIVVDNNSKADTNEYLKEWLSVDEGFEKKVYTMSRNLGGSGGFGYGFEKMTEEDVDWIWVADDDAYPEKDCFELIEEYINKDKEGSTVAVCSSVICMGKIDTWHRRRLKTYFGIIKEECIPAKEYSDLFELDFLSFVGSMIKKEALRKAGNVRTDFFIAYDDSEYSIRLRKFGKIKCIPKAKVIHDTQDIEIPNATGQNIAVSWKKFYAIRNKLYSYRIHYGKIQAWIYEMYYSLKNRKNKVLYQMTQKAVKMSRNSELGLDEVYNPMWKEEYK